MKNITIDTFSTYVGMGVVLLIIAGILWFLYKYSPLELISRRWQSVKYLIKQLVWMYSDQKSIFALKRVNAGLALYSFIVLTCFFVYYKRATLDATGFVLVTGPLILIAGYNIQQIQAEKKMNKIVDNLDGNKNADKDDQK